MLHISFRYLEHLSKPFLSIDGLDIYLPRRIVQHLLKNWAIMGQLFRFNCIVYKKCAGVEGVMPLD